MYEYFIGPTGVFNTPLTAILFTVLQFTFMATDQTVCAVWVLGIGSLPSDPIPGITFRRSEAQARGM